MDNLQELWALKIQFTAEVQLLNKGRFKNLLLDYKAHFLVTQLVYAGSHSTQYVTPVSPSWIQSQLESLSANQFSELILDWTGFSLKLRVKIVT